MHILTFKWHFFHTPCERCFHTPCERCFHTPCERCFLTPCERCFHTPCERCFHTPCERCFSKTKLIKNCLSSTVEKKRYKKLPNVILSIENEIAYDHDYEQIN